jgi:hypothetical protein
MININITNLSMSDKNWGGNDIPSMGVYFLEEVDRIRLLSDQSFIDALYLGEAVVNDGEYDLSPRVAIGLIQNNSIIVSEHYTLVQEDDILIGNGQILYLNDDTWSEDQEEVDDEE